MRSPDRTISVTIPAMIQNVEPSNTTHLLGAKPVRAPLACYSPSAPESCETRRLHRARSGGGNASAQEGLQSVLRPHRACPGGAGAFAQEGQSVLRPHRACPGGAGAFAQEREEVEAPAPPGQARWGRSASRALSGAKA